MTKLYFADTEGLGDPDVFGKFCETVPAHRQKKIDSMRFLKDKQLSLGAWLLLTHALKEEGIMDPDLQLHYGLHGKPYLSCYPDVYFSLSHSENRVLCAISHREVGCDVQKINKANPSLAERYFSPEECAAIVAAPAEERDDIFFRIWTLKESFIKNIGRGLSLPLRDFTVQLSEGGAEVIQQILPGEEFYFREYDLQDGYRYACCARSPEITDIKSVTLPVR